MASGEWQGASVEWRVASGVSRYRMRRLVDMQVIYNYASDNEYKLGACRTYACNNETTTGGSNMEIKIENKTATFCGKLWQPESATGRLETGERTWETATSNHMHATARCRA